MYGTTQEEWERQREARAKESQTQKPPPTPKRPSRTTAAPNPGTQASRSPSRATGRDEGDRSTRRDVGALRGQQDLSQRQPVAAIANERPADADWPSLSQGPARAAAAPPPAADVSSRTRASPSNIVPVNQRPERSPKSGTLNLPVNVQSLVNGTNTSLETVIDLSPPSGELHTYVQRDVQPLLQQLMSLKSNTKQTQAQAVSRQGAMAASRRQNTNHPPAPTGAPPGLERRDTADHAPHQRHISNAQVGSAAARPSEPVQQPRADQGATQDDLSSAFSKPPVQESFMKEMAGPQTRAGMPIMNGEVSAAASLPVPSPAPSLPPPPGLGPPPGFGPVPGAVAGPSVTPPPGLLDPVDGTTASRNILHELFLHDNKGKLGWFSKPLGFESNLHQLLDTSATVTQLIQPVCNSARHRRPLYARANDAASMTASREGSGSGQRGSSGREEVADKPRDPVVSLGRKLGGRHAEIGASLH